MKCLVLVMYCNQDFFLKEVENGINEAVKAGSLGQMAADDKYTLIVEKPKNPDDHVEYSFDTAPDMEIPSDWNTQNDKLFFYEGTIWFKKSFNYIKFELLFNTKIS